MTMISEVSGTLVIPSGKSAMTPRLGHPNALTAWLNDTAPAASTFYRDAR
jgi:hypothetical protein